MKSIITLTPMATIGSLPNISMSTREIRVSIGLPVFNGESYLQAAVDSLLAQTFTDFELILSDNGSTDRTPAICQAYAAQDVRVRYTRVAENRGAAWNFNHVFHLARGAYFKWAAHDDLLAPDYLEKCVAVLDRDPSVVVCHSQVMIIDGNDQPIREDDVRLDTAALQPWRRFRELLLKYHLCFDIFGVIRRRALEQTPLMGNYSHGDGVLLNRLALHGRFHQIPEVLFFSRMHGRQSMHVYGVYQPGDNDYHQYTVWFDPGKRGRLIFPTWRILGEHLRTVWQAPIGWGAKVLCFAFTGRWAIRRRRPLYYDLRQAARWLAQNRAAPARPPAVSAPEA
jgi:glycosyltransferase involved in cell wall biosynthesis